MQDQEYWIWISRLDLNPENFKKCLGKYSIQEIWKLKEKTLQKFFTSEEVQKLINKSYKSNLLEHKKYMDKYNIKLITMQDKEYPGNLKKIENMPICLYAIGNEKLLKTKSLAIVGSRCASQYGKTMSQAFAYLLAKNGVTIVSGLASGIDTSAHEGAIMARGNTVAVVGTGIDLVYPKENKLLMQEIIRNNGLIISEFSLGTKPNASNFPKRNRIISGISEGVLVVEAREKSGALITADFALEQGKDVFVVPGNITNESAKR